MIDCSMLDTFERSTRAIIAIATETGDAMALLRTHSQMVEIARLRACAAVMAARMEAQG